MIDFELEKLRYPIGRFKFNFDAGRSEFKKWIRDIEKHPENLKKAVKGLNEKKLNTPYRDGGWTTRQVVHHLFDSHSNSYTRMKLAMTEDNPIIKPYMEARWAELEDGKNTPVELGLNLLELLHKRWMIFLRSLTEKDLQRTFFHPDNKRSQTIAQTIALYAWHSRHHLAHITELKRRMGWR